MSQLFSRWLNEEVGLSKQVPGAPLDFAKTFSNGYLLGELLHSYNQFPEFVHFKDSDHADVKINNFCLLETAFRRLDITFNSDLAWQLLTCQPKAINSLMYEIKVKIEQIAGAPSSDIGQKPGRWVTALLWSSTRNENIG